MEAIVNFITENPVFSGLYVSLGAIFISIVGVIITLRSNSAAAQKQATLHLLMDEETNPVAVKNREKFIELKKRGNISDYAKEEMGSENQSVVRAELNRYELIAVGINNGILHDKSYKAWNRSTLVEDWIECKGYVMEIRNRNKTYTYFSQLEKLAKKWAKGDEVERV